MLGKSVLAQAGSGGVELGGTHSLMPLQIGRGFASRTDKLLGCLVGIDAKNTHTLLKEVELFGE